MDLSTINPALLVASLMISATPILLAALGETIVEKSGVLNPVENRFETISCCSGLKFFFRSRHIF